MENGKGDTYRPYSRLCSTIGERWEENSEEATYRFTMRASMFYLRAVATEAEKDPSEPEIGYCLYVNASDRSPAMYIAKRKRHHELRILR